jgi:hypothetical protein
MFHQFPRLLAVLQPFLGHVRPVALLGRRNFQVHFDVTEHGPEPRNWQSLLLSLLLMPWAEFALGDYTTVKILSPTSFAWPILRNVMNAIASFAFRVLARVIPD